MDDKDLEIEALKSELDAALRKISELLVYNKSVYEAAWWMCANHAQFVIDHPNLFTLGKKVRLIDMACVAGMPPKGDSWSGWFERLEAMHGESDD